MPLEFTLRESRWSLAKVVALGVTLGLVSSGGSALAQERAPESAFSPSVMGMGGAFRGVSQDMATLELNPGAMGLSTTYGLDVSFGTQGDLGNGVGRLTVVDGKTRPGIVGGFSVELGWSPAPVESYGWEVVGASAQEVELNTRARAFTFGFGIPLSMDRRSSLGFTVKVDRLDLPDEDPNRTVNGDVGLYLRPIPQIAVGLVGNNIRPTGDANTPTTVGLGTALYVIPQVILAADGVMDFTTQERISGAFHIGIEGTTAGILPLRFGFYTEPDQLTGIYNRYLTAGVGVLSSPMSLGYALRVELTDIGGSDSIFYHLLGVSIEI